MPILENDDRVVGTQGYLFFGNPPTDDPPDPSDPFPPDDPPFDANSTRIPITLWDCKIDKHTVDATNSTNYHPGTGMIYGVHAQTSINAEGSIEGRFRLSVIPDTIVASLYSDRATPEITLAFAEFFVFAQGFAIITSFRTSNPIDDTVNFWAAWKSYGVFDVNVGQQPINPILGK
jgi:hypothetical protein